MIKKIYKLYSSHLSVDYKYAIFIQAWKFDKTVLNELKVYLQSTKIDFRILRVSKASEINLHSEPRVLKLSSSFTYAPVYVIYLSTGSFLFLKLIQHIYQNFSRLTILKVQQGKLNLSLEQLNYLSSPKARSPSLTFIGLRR